MAEAVQWRDDWSQALEEAKKEGRPVALEFYMDGWPHCSRLVRETHENPEVAQKLNENFIPVRLEGRSHMDLVQKYGVRGTPTTLVFTPEGEEKHRFVGFMAPKEYMQELEKAAWGWTGAESFLSAGGLNNPEKGTEIRNRPDGRSLHPGLSPGEVKRWREIVYRHYRAHKREMPWRQTRDPYHILVSEIMLQQTQVERVLGKYGLFLRHFPDFSTLARASWAEVLALWQGLGYNRRALALKRLAQEVVTEWRGRLPDRDEDLRALPGIGPATAGALLAFAFEQPVVFIETNIRRVFLHFFFAQQNGIKDRDILPLVAETLDRERVREWYYALMDYGAALKKLGPDPNRRSAHYARQSPFSGSNREVRSLILKTLLTAPADSLEELARDIRKPKGRTGTALEQLLAEGFVVWEGTRLRLASRVWEDYKRIFEEGAGGPVGPPPSPQAPLPTPL